MSTIITIGICTFRRAHIVNTLASLAEQILPLNTTLHIVVADNDDTPSAQITVTDAAARFGLTVQYLHAPARNISIARNACLDAATGEYFVFLDDDELAENLWLSELLEKHRSSNAEIVLGPVFSLYPQGAPRWAVFGDFHSTKPDEPQSTITTGYAGNVLMKRDALALANLRFDERFGLRGGEDTDFFSRAHKAGARIAYAEKAVVHEPVPFNRISLAWLLKRRARYGETHAQALLDAKKPRIPNMIIAAAKMLTCYAMVPLTALSPVGRRRWLLRGTLHLGVVRALHRAGNSSNA